MHTQFHPEKNIFGVLDKEGHRRKRKIYSQILSDRSLRTFEPTMAREIKVFLRHLLRFESEPVNMAPVCQYVTADITGHLAFGQSLHTQTEPTNRPLINAMASVNGITNLCSKRNCLHISNHFLCSFRRRSSTERVKLINYLSSVLA